jgi:signal transduction histidine kinase
MSDQGLSRPVGSPVSGAYPSDAGHYLALVAHELSDPLTPIINAAAVMRDQPADEERVRRCADIIARQARHMMGLIEDLMQFSRMQNGKWKLMRARVSMAEIVRRAVETATPFCLQRIQRLRVSVASERVVLDADAARLTQALRNLIVNASKFSEAGSEIQVRAEREGGDVLVSISDTGIGIDLAELELIFTLSRERADGRASPLNGGLGIGLYLARQFAEAHGGSLRAASPGVGKGSTFMLRIPCLAADSDSAEALVNTPSTDPTPASPRRSTHRTASRAADDREP